MRWVLFCEKMILYQVKFWHLKNRFIISALAVCQVAFCCQYTLSPNLYLGGSRGCEGRAPPPVTQKFFIFVQEKLAKWGPLRGWRPLWEILDPPLLYSSPRGYKTFVTYFHSQKRWMTLGCHLRTWITNKNNFFQSFLLYHFTCIPNVRYHYDCRKSLSINHSSVRQTQKPLEIQKVKVSHFLMSQVDLGRTALKRL